MIAKPTYEELERKVRFPEETASGYEKVSERVHHGEDLYRDIFQKNNAVKLLIDPNSGNIIDANIAACKFYQYSLEELKSLKIWDINVLGKPETQRHMALAMSGEISDFLFQHRLASGEIRDVHVYSGTLQTDKQKLLHSIVIDMTESRRATKALVESENKYRNLVDSIKDWIWTIDVNGVHTFTNGAIEEILGFNPEQIIRRSSFTLMHSDSRPHFEAALKKSIEQKEGWHNLELKRLHKDGSTRYFESSSHPHFDNQGNLIGFSGVDHDITDRKKTEQVLLQHQKHMKQIRDIGALANSSLHLDVVLQSIVKSTVEAVNASAGMIFLKDLDSGLLFLGASSGLTKALVADFQSRPVRPGEGLTGRIAQTGKSIYIKEGSSHDPRIVRSVIKKEGLHSFIGVPVYADEKIVGVMDILTRPPDTLSEENVDLIAAVGSQVGLAIHNAQLFKKQQETEAALRDGKKRLNAVLDATTETVLLLDREGIVHAANQIVCDRLGITRGELIGKRVYDFLPTDVAERRKQKFDEVFETGKSVSFEDKREEMFFEQCIYPILDDGDQVAMAVLFAKDNSDRRKAEEALRENEAFLKMLIDAIPTPVFYKDRDGKYLGFNSAFETFFGKTREMLIGKSVFDINPPELAEVYHAHDDELFNRGGVQRYDSQWKNVYGEVRDFIFNKAVFTDGKGAVSGLIGVLSDITEQKRAEEALRESEEKFRLTYSSSPDAISINRLRDGVCIDINDGFTKLTGFTREDVCGKTPTDIPIWHDPADKMKMVQELQKNGFCDNLEALFRRKDGSLTTALLSARVISFKNEAHVISITRDISERKQAEAERERLILAIEQANEIVVITDASGNIQYVNPAFEKITEYSKSEALGKTPRILKSGHHNEAFYDDLWSTISAGNSWTGRLLNKRKNGALYSAECSISPVKDKNGHVINYVWISRDTTNELELERRISQAQKMEAIGVLAGGIAHDFNNLLFPITGLAELLLEDLPKGSYEHKNVQEILKAGKRGSELVKRILAFSRQSEHKKIPVRIQEVLKEVLSLSRAAIPSSIEIVQDIQMDAGLVVADPTQIHQIAMNLITNAYHAMERPGGNIIVRFKETFSDADDLARNPLKPGKFAMLSISDTGCGIDPAIKDKIFEPYFTTKEEGKGTGLGLAVVYGIVEEYGGDIHVDSEMGKGTTFTVRFPLMTQSPEPESVEKEEILQTGNERILLVDDDESIAELEKQMLERLGYRVTSRTSSLDALDLFRAHPNAFDMVFSDMTMPDMNGDRLAGELISIRPDIPVIICTGFTESFDQLKADTTGIKDFIMKPVILSKMARVVRKVLDEAKS